MYQKMKGLVESENEETPGFTCENDTEIPQLRDHAQKLTEELRIVNYQEVLSGVCSLLNSVAIWAEGTAHTGIDEDWLMDELAKIDNVRVLTFDHIA